MQLGKSVLMRILGFLCIVCCLFALAFGLSACSDGKDGIGIASLVINQNGELVITYSDGSTANLGVIAGTNGTNGTNGTDGKTPYIKNGNWWIGETDTGVKAAGTDGTNGTDGTDGKTPYIKNGNWWIGETDTGVKAAGTDGTNGTDGTDGKTPYIKNGNWWIGETDTGVKAAGQDGTNGADGTDGLTPEIGENGNWWIGNVDTGVKAQGADGEAGVPGKSAYDVAVENGFEGTEAEWLASLKGTDGLTPEIGENGNWWIGSVDTGVKAQGANGEAGVPGKSAYDVAIENGFEGTEAEWLASLKGADGRTPEIGENGNWWIGSVDTGVKAQGANGEAGVPGKSAYDVAVENGFEGTEAEWLASLKGADGANGQDGKGIVSIAPTEDGKLLITYTNGDTDTVDMPVMEQVCEHDYLFVMTVKDATCYEAGLELYVCAKNCGSATLKESPTTEHDWEEIVVEPTCEEKGYTYDRCKICGDESERRDETEALGHELETYHKDPTCTEDGEEYRYCTRCDYQSEITVIPATGHSWIEDVPVVMPGGTTVCEDGGFIVKACTTCHITEIEYIDPTGHHSENWSVKTAPSEEKEGELEGVCSACGEIVTYPLPVLGSKDEEGNLYYEYTVLEAKQSCSDTGLAVYSVTVDGQEFTFRAEIPATLHILTRADGSKEPIDDGKVYLLEDYPELKVAGNAGGLTCESTGVTAYFYCAECGELILVNVKINHSEPENATEETVEVLPAVADMEAGVIYIVAPTCDDKGVRAYLCGVCGEYVETEIKALGHDLKYSLVELGDGSFQVKETCSRNCGYEKTYEADSVETAVTPATCTAEGKIVYTITYQGVTFTAEETIEKLDHNHEEYGRLSDRKVYDITEYPNIKIPGNVPTSCSDAGAQGYFICTECGDLILIWVQYPHTKPLNATEVNLTELPYEGDLEAISADAEGLIDANVIYTFAATCEAKGYVIYRCGACNEVCYEELPALGHAYEGSYTLTDNGDGTYTLKGVCANDESHVDLKVLSIDDMQLIDSKNATCEEEGYERYQYLFEGKNYYVTITFEKTWHLLNGNEIDESKVHSIGNGIKQTGNSAPACNSDGYGTGYFVCDHCGEVIIVMVRQSHTKPANAAEQTLTELPYEGDPEAIVADAEGLFQANVVYTFAATCDAEGYVIYRCNVCNEVVCEVLDAIGHSYTYSEVTFTEEGLPATVITCVHDGCTFAREVILPALDGEGYVKETLSEAACNAVGLDRYTYVYTLEDGETVEITFTVRTEKTDHNFEDAPYVWDYNGIRYTAYYCEDCGQMIVIDMTEITE